MKVTQEPGCCILCANRSPGWQAEGSHSIPGRCSTSRPAPELGQPHSQWLLEAVFMRIRWPRPKTDHSLDLVSRLRMTEAIPQPPPPPQPYVFLAWMGTLLPYFKLMCTQKCLRSVSIPNFLSPQNRKSTKTMPTKLP